MKLFSIVGQRKYYCRNWRVYRVVQKVLLLFRILSWKCRPYQMVQEEKLSVKELMQTGRGNVDSPVKLALKQSSEFDGYSPGVENQVLFEAKFLNIL